jgi:hypothetical protein
MAFDVLDYVDSGDNVTVLIRSTDLELDPFCQIHVPPIPCLKKRISELRKGHAITLLHLRPYAKVEQCVKKWCFSKKHGAEYTYVSLPSIGPILTPRPRT